MKEHKRVDYGLVNLLVKELLKWESELDVIRVCEDTGRWQAGNLERYKK